MQLLILMYITGGQPARAPEILGVRHVNTVKGNHRNLFVTRDTLWLCMLEQVGGSGLRLNSTHAESGLAKERSLSFSCRKCAVRSFQKRFGLCLSVFSRHSVERAL